MESYKVIVFVAIVLSVLIALVLGGFQFLSDRASESVEQGQAETVGPIGRQQPSQAQVEFMRAACLQKNNIGCIKYEFDASAKLCIGQPSTPCCGNNVCEAGESDTCSQDCQATVISQTQKDIAFPVKYIQNSNDFQLAAQTFTAPDDLDLIGVAPYIDYAIGNDKATLFINELSDPAEPDGGKSLAAIDLNVSDFPMRDFYEVQFAPLRVHKGQEYSFVIYLENKTSEIRVGRMSYKDVFSGGKAWYYTRLFGGNGEILDSKHGWRTYNDDLTFKLIFNKPKVVTQTTPEN